MEVVMSENKSLRALVTETARIEELLTDSLGELTPEIEQAIAVVDFHLPQKVDNYKMTIDRFELITNYYKEKAESFLRIAKGADKIVSRCHENLKEAMTRLELNEINGNDFSFKLVNNPPSADIPDDNEVPDAYAIIKQVRTIDKKRVLDDLKLGVPIQGATLKRGQRVKPGIKKAGE
jgi:hypothetical protein